MSSFLNRWLGRSPELFHEPGRIETRMLAPEPAVPVASAPPEAPQPSTEAPPASRTTPPSPFGQFGENGEKVGEHISYFLARLDDVYSLRQEFAAVAEPMQQFVRSHDEAQTRLAETVALLSRERDEGQLSRSDNLALRAANARIDNALVEANNQLKMLGETSERRGSELRSLQIAHDDASARLDWATRQLASEAQTSREKADAHRLLVEELAKLEQELAHERARNQELKDLQEAAGAEIKRMQAQLERLSPSLAAAKRRVTELENDASAGAALLGMVELKLAGEQDTRRATEALRSQEKASYETELSALTLQLEAMEGRQQTTTRLFEQTRALLNEKIDETRMADRATKDLSAEKIVLERRHASAQDEIRRLLDQASELGARHGDTQERCSMLTNALAAKDAHIEQLQARAEASKAQLDDAVMRHEQERTAIDATNRKLIEEVQSERAERALAQGALSIARGSREKLLAQIEDLKRNRVGRLHDTDSREPPRDPEGGGNITRFRAPEPAGDNA